MRAFATVIVVLAIAGTQACSSDPADPGGDGPDFGDDPVVTLTASTFSPSTLEIDAGQEVHWHNTSGILHNITPDNPAQTGVWSARSIGASGTTSHTFNVAGQTYDYHCTLHPGMTGRIVVRSAT